MSNARPAWRNAPLGALCLCTSLLCLGIGQAARADAPSAGVKPAPVIALPPAPANSPVVVPRADHARRTAHFGPATGWVNIALATGSDGSSYSVWSYSDGTMAEWGYDAYGNEMFAGPTYGPYAGGNNTTWYPVSIGVNSINDNAKILWNRSDGAAGVWTMNPDGYAVAIGPTYGPYQGWTAIGIATGDGGTSDLLWRRSDGAMSEWVLNNANSVTSEGPTYGPYTVGTNITWEPIAIGTDTADYSARILWERTDGVVGVWIMYDNGSYIGGGDNTYGPYSDGSLNWNPVGIATADDGSSALLWARDDGAGGVWGLDSNVNVSYVGPTYGPYSDSGGTWEPSAYGNGIGLDPSDDTTRVLWNRSDGATGLWAFDPMGNESAVGPVYGPYLSE